MPDSLDIENSLPAALMMALVLGLTLVGLYTSGRDHLRTRAIRQRAQASAGLAQAAAAVGVPAPTTAAVWQDSGAFDASAILDAVGGDRQPAEWRVYRFLGRGTWIVLQIVLLVCILGVGQALIRSGAGRSSATIPLLIGALLLLVLGAGAAYAYRARLRRSLIGRTLGRALSRYEHVVILTPQGMVAGQLFTSVVSFQLRYQEVADLTTERIGISGEGAREHHWLHATFVDGSATSWECLASEAKPILSQILRDWRACAV